jgi:hypothetical protein
MTKKQLTLLRIANKVRAGRVPDELSTVEQGVLERVQTVIGLVHHREHVRLCHRPGERCNCRPSPKRIAVPV